MQKRPLPVTGDGVVSCQAPPFAMASYHLGPIPEVEAAVFFTPFGRLARPHPPISCGLHTYLNPWGLLQIVAVAATYFFLLLLFRVRLALTVVGETSACARALQG